MKNIILPVVIVILVLAAGMAVYFFGPSLLPKNEKFAALQINSLPEAKVFLENKEVGKTPYNNEKLKPGEYLVKLEPTEDGIKLVPWTGKVKLTAETMTVVNWQMGETDKLSEGETLSLEPSSDKKTSELAILTLNPDSTEVKIDAQSKGTTPIIMRDLTAGDHEVVLEKDGFNQRTIPVKIITGYRLTVSAKLSTSEESTTSAKKEKPKEASDSAEIKKTTVVINETDTGWLRVRFEPSLNATEAAKVNPGDEFELLEEKEGWTKIEYEKGKFGWVSSQYVEKKENQ